MRATADLVRDINAQNGALRVYAESYDQLADEAQRFALDPDTRQLYITVTRFADIALTAYLNEQRRPGDTRGERV